MRGCLFALVAYVGVSAAYAAVLRPHLDSPLHIVAGFIGAMFSLGLVNVIVLRVRTWRDMRLIRAAERREAPVDGRMTAVIGALSPQGALLRSPIGDQPCVAYEYDVGVDRVYHQSVSTGSGRSRRRSGAGRTTRTTSTMYAGVALAPAVISTLHGAVRLLSFPAIDGFERQRRSGPTARDRVLMHIGRVAPKRQSFLEAIGGFAGTPTDTVGGLRLDMRLMNDTELPSAVWTHERLVPADAQVCAIGRYSADRRGLGGRGSQPVRLLPGQPDQARAYLRKASRAHVPMAILLFLVSHAAIVGGAYLGATRHLRETPEQQAATLGRLISERDQAALARAIQRGASPNALNAAGEAAVHLVGDAETVRTLAAAGADINAIGGAGRTPLMFAVVRQQPEVVQAWIDAGAKVNVARLDGATALTDAEEAGDQEIAELLRAAGGRCDHVNAERGQLLGPDASTPLAAGARSGSPAVAAGAVAPRDTLVERPTSEVERPRAALERSGAEHADGDREVVQVIHDYLAAVHAGDVARLRVLTVGHPAGFFESVNYEAWRASRPRSAAGAQGYRNAEAATITLPSFDGLGQPLIWAYQLRRVGPAWKVAREWELLVRPAEPVRDADTPEDPAAAPVDDVERPRQPAPPPPAGRPRR